MRNQGTGSLARLPKVTQLAVGPGESVQHRLLNSAYLLFSAPSPGKEESQVRPME
jgi:hypothetical protein